MARRAMPMVDLYRFPSGLPAYDGYYVDGVHADRVSKLCGNLVTDRRVTFGSFYLEPVIRGLHAQGYGVHIREGVAPSDS